MSISVPTENTFTYTFAMSQITVNAERNFERSRRWRWLPWLLTDQWWASFTLDGTACFVVEDSKEALTHRVIEHARFVREDERANVIVWWVGGNAA